MSETHSLAPFPLDPAKGGRARAEKLTPEERQEIARRGAEARWGNSLPKATHGSPDHPLKIANIDVPCYVIEGGIRVITHRGLQRSLGIAESGGAQRMANLMTRIGDKGIDAKDLPARISRPIEFQPTRGGRSAFGYEATVLADICDVILAARSAGQLHERYALMAQQCEILVRGFARVGIIALIDEATGYQYDRARIALEEILERFISDELVKWAKMFPDEFYQEMFRLRGWEYKERSIKKRPALVGKLTVDVVYERLAPCVLQRLKEITPRDAKGRLKHHYHRRLTEEVGHPKLREHLASVIALMRASDDWSGFYRLLKRALPKQVQTPLIDLMENSSEENATRD